MLAVLWQFSIRLFEVYNDQWLPRQMVKNCTPIKVAHEEGKICYAYNSANQQYYYLHVQNLSINAIKFFPYLRNSSKVFHVLEAYHEKNGYAKINM